MKQNVQNFRGTRRLRVMSTFLPFAVLPILAMGVTVPVAGIGSSEHGGVASARLAAEEAERTRRELKQFGSLEQVAELDVATQLLRGLLPQPQREISVFNQVRHAAEEVALQLRTLSVSEPLDTGLAVGDSTAFLREIGVGGVGTLDQIWSHVEQLRKQGLPTVVFQVSVSRGRPSDLHFQFTARLGTYHVGPSIGTTGEDSLAAIPEGD